MALSFQITEGNVFSVLAWFCFSQSGQLLNLFVCLDTIRAHVVYVSRMCCSILPCLYRAPAFPKTCCKASAPTPNTIQ